MLLSKIVSATVCCDTMQQVVPMSGLMVYGACEMPVSPLTVTVMTPEVAPVGTFTVREPDALAVTSAASPLNRTMLLALSELKFVPVMTTSDNSGPLVGVNPEMLGVGVGSEEEQDHNPMTRTRRTGTEESCLMRIR